MLPELTSVADDEAVVHVGADVRVYGELAPGTDGMCHISELTAGYIRSVTDVVKVGDEVKVKVILIDDQGRIKLSRKAALSPEEAAAESEKYAMAGGGEGDSGGGGREDRGGGG